MLFLLSSIVPSVYSSFGYTSLSNTVSFVIIHFSMSSLEGNSNIISSIMLSIMERRPRAPVFLSIRSEEHTSELQSRFDLVCRLLLEKKKQKRDTTERHRRIHIR